MGTDDLQPLENMSTETFKGFLKDRPLMMKFVAAAAATASGSSAYAADPQDASTDAVYSIVAGPDVAKLGITFNGMPPGRIDVKGVAAGSFGSESGVREGDALIEVGKDEFLPLEGMTSETFKSLLKDRPLRMKFQATSAVAHADAPTPAEDHAAPAPQGTANSVEAAKEAVSHPLMESGEYTVVASSEVGKLGISFHGMPPGRIEVKGVAEGLFGSTSGVKEGDVLVEVGTDDLQPLENMSTETFKGFLKDRPLMMKFVAAAAATASGGSAYAADPPKPVEQDASTDAVYTIVAGPDVAKLGITFNGMPPGRIDVKGVAAGSFGSESGVREGDALIEVGKDEFLPLEGMTSETFKSLLKDRPLRMKFQATSAVAHADAPTPAEDHAAPAPQGTANSVEAAKEAVSHPLLESGEYTVVASSEVGKLGISFHGMPPGRIEVKGVAEGLFGSTSGVKEGDVLVEVGTDDLQPLENMSTETFKGFLKDRPLMMKFVAAAAATASGGSAYAADPPKPVEQDASTDAVYSIVAGPDVAKLGITFNGMPPGRIDVKGIAAGSFGSESGVREGDALIEVGKDEFLPLEDMTSETFKSLLKDRPLRMKFQATSAVAQADAPTPAEDHAAPAPQGTANIVEAAKEAVSHPLLESGEYTVVASSEVGKLGISFHGMPPGRIEVKGVAEGLFGSTSGVKEGDVLVEVGTDDLQPLENMSTETFKGFLKDRPLMMKFVAAAAATASGGSAYAADPPKPVEQDASTDAVYSIVAGPDVAKLGITFNGMPPGRIDVKGVAAGSFGSESGVREGDALIEVGKDEFLPLEGMTSETFKSLLKDRPLRMKFQATSAVAHADAPTPAEDHAAPAPQGTANSVEAAKEAVSHPLLESGEYTVVASSEVGKLGISFHGMPPGRIEVKGVAEGLFGSTSGVKEGDVLVEVGTDDLQPLENMSTDTFKGFLKDRPLMMRFLVHGWYCFTFFHAFDSFYCF